MQCDKISKNTKINFKKCVLKCTNNNESKNSHNITERIFTMTTTTKNKTKSTKSTEPQEIQVRSSLLTSKLIYNTSVAYGLIQEAYKTVMGISGDATDKTQDETQKAERKRAVFEVHGASIIIQDVIGYFSDEAYSLIGEYSNDILVLLHDSELSLNVLSEEFFTSDSDYVDLGTESECVNTLDKVMVNLRGILDMCKRCFGEDNPFE